MARFVKFKKETIGLSPDSLTFRGDKKIDSVRIRSFDYNNESLEEKELEDASSINLYDTSKSTTWINIDGLHDAELMQTVASKLDLDLMLMSDVLNPHSRPKIREYDNCLYFSLKMLRYNSEEGLIDAENFALVLKDNLVITFQEKVGDVFDPIRQRIRNSKRRIRSAGPDYLTAALLDVIIDNYIYVVSSIGEEVENLEEQLLGNPADNIFEELIWLKKEINYLRSSINPFREALLIATKSGIEHIKGKNLVHFKEVQSNLSQALELVESYREIIVDQINTYNTQLSNKLNDIMKFLTVFSVIFIPLTFMAGIYGMNFVNIPELQTKYGYFILLGVMVIVALTMVYIFKRKKWL